MWQVSGSHGVIDPVSAVAAMVDYHRAGFTAWDLADHYGPAEDLITEYRKRVSNELGEAEVDKMLLCTKWVPTNLETRWTLDATYSLPFVEKNIDVSLRRMNVQELDLLQFHWWDHMKTHVYSNVLIIFLHCEKRGRLKK